MINPLSVVLLSHQWGAVQYANSRRLYWPTMASPDVGCCPPEAVRPDVAILEFSKLRPPAYERARPSI
jgi:hypothetical protein